ncbi:MAG: hypothetical protein H6660_08695 [Ardenticatenaceae bacterium]|nr:hypothetical protein [Ardenticatenaceae bacterium]
MNIPMKAAVVGKDGAYGQVYGVVIRPQKQPQLTHIIIAEGDKNAPTRYIVPIQQIANISDTQIELTCGRAELTRQESVPEGGVLLNHEAKAKAKDGVIGPIVKIIVTPKTGHIGNLVVQTGGFLQGKRQFSVPDTLLGQVEEMAYHIKIDKQNLTMMRPAR